MDVESDTEEDDLRHTIQQLEEQLKSRMKNVTKKNSGHSEGKGAGCSLEHTEATGTCCRRGTRYRCAGSPGTESRVGCTIRDTIESCAFTPCCKTAGSGGDSADESTDTSKCGTGR